MRFRKKKRKKRKRFKVWEDHRQSKKRPRNKKIKRIEVRPKLSLKEDSSRNCLASINLSKRKSLIR
jgi:hypothetical protein